MNRVIRGAGLLLALAGCERQAERQAAVDTAELASRAIRLEELKTAHDSNAAIARWVLPNSLNEISGLALTGDGRLLGHDDETGLVTIYDYRRGVIAKQFRVGRNLREDFEGITRVGADFWMLASNGKLYQFREGADGGRVPYTMHDTQLGRECEFEGVVYDPGRNELELSCKHVGTRKLRNQLVIYRWSLDETRRNRISRLAVPLGRIIGSRDWKTVEPSDITLDPISGNYVLVASQQKALITVSPEGGVVSVRDLPPGHDQAEGVAITPDSILIVSDEALHRPAMITLYRWPLM